MKFFLFISIIFIFGCNEDKKLGDCYIQLNDQSFGPYLTNQKSCDDLKNFVNVQISNNGSCHIKDLNTSNTFHVTNDVKITTLNEKGWKLSEVIDIAKNKLKNESHSYFQKRCNSQ